MSNSFAGFAGIGQTLLGGLTSAFGSLFKGDAEKQMYDYQAGVARLNAQIAQQNSAYALQIGEQQAQGVGLQGGQRMGQIKAAQAASGLDVNSGTAVDVRASQKEWTGIQTAAVRSSAAKTAYNYQVQSVQFGAQAQLDTLAGQNARSAGMIGAASSIVGTASSVSSEWMRGSQLGLWGQGQQNTNTGQSLGSSGGNQSLGGIGMM